MEIPPMAVHIRAYRRASGQSLHELGRKIDRGKTYVDTLERNVSKNALQELGVLADALNIAPWELVVYEHWPVPICPCQRALLERNARR